MAIAISIPKNLRREAVLVVVVAERSPDSEIQSKKDHFRTGDKSLSRRGFGFTIKADPRDKPQAYVGMPRI